MHTVRWQRVAAGLPSPLGSLSLEIGSMPRTAPAMAKRIASAWRAERDAAVHAVAGPGWQAVSRLRGGVLETIRLSDQPDGSARIIRARTLIRPTLARGNPAPATCRLALLDRVLPTDSRRTPSPGPIQVDAGACVALYQVTDTPAAAVAACARRGVVGGLRDMTPHDTGVASLPVVWLEGPQTRIAITAHRGQGETILVVYWQTRRNATLGRAP
ncbi:MAG: hypothetical protein H6934_13120 [Burkholderiaceae bacterium]|nr:hypothetical protein [Burkholderiaceae bacterium]